MLGAGGSTFSKLGLTIGRTGDAGPDLAMSAETRSFSGSPPILALDDDWRMKKDSALKGGDRCKILVRNTVKMRTSRFV